MSTRHLAAFLSIALAASAAVAQPASAPAAPASAATPKMNMHDHAKEKGGAAPMASSHMDKAHGAKKSASGARHEHAKEKNN